MGFLGDLKSTVSLSFIFGALFVLLIIFFGDFQDIDFFWIWSLRFLHVVAGIIWVGLLFYFNFVQIPNLNKIHENQRPAVVKFLAPTALFWFRWSALITIFLGILLAYFQGYLFETFTLFASHWIIGVVMYLGIIMFLNVWLVIWPNQKKLLGITIVENEEKNIAAKKAFKYSRITLALYIPMLISMTAHQNLFS